MIAKKFQKGIGKIGWLSLHLLVNALLVYRVRCPASTCLLANEPDCNSDFPTFGDCSAPCTNGRTNINVPALGNSYKPFAND